MSERAFVRAHRRAAARRRRRTVAAAAGVALAAAANAPGAAAADFPVTNTDPTGAGSLRAAVTSANTAPGPDTVSFAANVTGTIDLGSDPIEITDSLSVLGPGAGALAVDGGGDRIFEIYDLDAVQRAVTISGLTLTEGSTAGDGGAIRNVPGVGIAANLIVRDCVLSESVAVGTGGAIYSDGGNLTIDGTTLTGNSTQGISYGGAIYVADTSGSPGDNVTITNSRISGNSAAGDGGGAYFASPDGDLRIEETTISGNGAVDDGGGIVITSPTQGATIDSSTISGNTAINNGGGVLILGTAEPVLISDSTILGNAAGSGGGISSFQIFDAPVTVRNSTVSGNEAAGAGGGIFRRADDSGAFPGTDDLNLSSTIVSGNLAASGPDLSDNVVPGATIAGTFSAGFSLIGDTAGNVSLVSSPSNSNLLGVDPQLGPLAINGGPTRTALPALSSPAIDAGTSNALVADQRGEPRTVKRSFEPVSDGTDIGAVELGDAEVAGGEVRAKKKQRQRGREIVIKVKVSSQEDITAEASGKVKAGRKRYGLQRFSRTSNAGRSTLLTLNVKGRAPNRKVQKLLARGKKATAKVKVELKDAAGNTLRETAKVKLVGKKEKRKG